MSTNDRSKPRTPFLLWAWTMLMVVLLSAAPTGGEPRSRLVGSAFDPASMTVALSAKQPKAKVRAARPELPDQRLDSPPALAASEASPSASRIAAAGAPRARSFARLVVPASLTRAHGPRAPPAA